MAALFVWLSIAMVTWRFPISFLPDAQVRWQLRRLLRSAEVLLASVSAESGVAPGPWRRWSRRHPDEDMNRQLVPFRALGEELRSDLRDMLKQLRNNPGLIDVAACKARLERAHTVLETRYGGAIEGDSVDNVESSAPRDALLNLYRLLGGYRGVVEALDEVLESTQAIDWDSLSSVRF